jgi:hypothetical protein
MPANPDAARYGASWRLYGDWPPQLRAQFLMRSAQYGQGHPAYLAHLLECEARLQAIDALNDLQEEVGL